MIVIIDIKGFIFDLDGVITETAEYHYRSWKRMTEEENIYFDREVNEKLRGLSRENSLDVILDGEKVSQQRREHMLQRKNQYYHELINKMTRDFMIPGVKKLLFTLKEKGYKLAVASASKNAIPILKKLGIIDLFLTISDGNSVTNIKPAPDIFLHTAEKLNLEPSSCVVIEDSEAGIEAALAAGMLTVGIGPKERVGRADLVYERVADIKLENILN